MENKDIKILIIEDDPILIKIYQKKFASLGYQVFTAYDGEEGLQKAKELVPNLIILDIMLPKKNGFAVLTSIREDKSISDKISIMVISNLGQNTDKKRCEDLGISDFIVKNTTGIEKLITRVEEILKKII